ncbi:Uncharacterized protein Adt_04541 [Abeliophyllum distichum]|uniref:Uncharacterized protein n=1 Tax=Abeliophyllum distichum TaxID=126358 RepID=A0ABD1V1K8_9LAMI
MVPNLEFGAWMSTDKLLMSWLYALYDCTDCNEGHGSKSSKALWDALKESFGVQNKSRIVFLTARKKLSHDDLVTQVVAEFDDDYNPIVVQLNSRDTHGGSCRPIS